MGSNKAKGHTRMACQQQSVDFAKHPTKSPRTGTPFGYHAQAHTRVHKMKEAAAQTLSITEPLPQRQHHSPALKDVDVLTLDSPLGRNGISPAPLRRIDSFRYHNTRATTFTMPNHRATSMSLPHQIVPHQLQSSTLGIVTVPNTAIRAVTISLEVVLGSLGRPTWVSNLVDGKRFLDDAPGCQLERDEIGRTSSMKCVA